MRSPGRAHHALATCLLKEPCAASVGVRWPVPWFGRNDNDTQVCATHHRAAGLKEVAIRNADGQYLNYNDPATIVSPSPAQLQAVSLCLHHAVILLSAALACACLGALSMSTQGSDLIISLSANMPTPLPADLPPVPGPRLVGRVPDLQAGPEHLAHDPHHLRLPALEHYLAGPGRWVGLRCCACNKLCAAGNCASTCRSMQGNRNRQQQIPCSSSTKFLSFTPPTWTVYCPQAAW